MTAVYGDACSKHDKGLEWAAVAKLQMLNLYNGS